MANQSPNSLHSAQGESGSDRATVSFQHAEPAPLNNDVSTMMPPAYTQSISNAEQSVDAEAVRSEKVYHSVERRPSTQSVPTVYPLQQQASHTSSSGCAPAPSVTQQEQQRLYVIPDIPTPSAGVSIPIIGHYLTEPASTASLVGVRPCSILQDRPAIWLVRRKKLALSPLVAAVLTKEGLIRPKDLELISQHSGSRRDPTDPLSGLILGAYDTLGEILLGLIAGPVEMGKQASPMLKRYESRQRLNYEGVMAPIPSQYVKGVPHAAGQVALSTGKGLCRVVTAGLKSPMFFMNGLTRGFHNLPKSYGDDVREFENVTGMRSGLLVSAKSFGYGMSDGVRDLFAKPIEGAEQNGVVGFGTGCAKGIANVIVKPMAGACGLVGYSSVGLYKSIRKLNGNRREETSELVRTLGEAEYQQATDADKLFIVRVWCQTQMHVRLT